MKLIAEQAVAANQSIFYVTERCVFQLTNQGMTLIEVAPGIDIEGDILGQMGFEPVIPGKIKTMDARIFSTPPMQIA